ncbi:MAG: hypothetical protein U0136_14390 [Bdellovibrionota bacterium]
MLQRPNQFWRNWAPTLIPLLILLLAAFYGDSPAYAQYTDFDEPSPGLKEMFVKLLRGPMGTLVMIFCGMSGFALFYTNREGKAGERAPIGAFALLISAVLLFILRVMLSSGMMGAKYLDYGP